MPTLDKPHWSASQFTLFEQCPQAYKERYIDGLPIEPSLAMLFGSAVHKSLEALLQPGGQSPLEDAYDVYWREFRSLRATLEPLGIQPDGLLYFEGKRMIDQVNSLNLQDTKCEPERWFSLDYGTGLSRPIVGAADLWCLPESKHGPMIYDFKTTAGSWSADRAKREKWQPILYAWAYARQYDVVPTFRYMVLNRASGTLDVFDRTWSRRELHRAIDDLRFDIEDIATAITNGDFECYRSHGVCPECGEQYAHGHVCAAIPRNKVTLVGSKR